MMMVQRELDMLADRLCDDRERVIDLWRQACRRDITLPTIHDLTRQAFRNNIDESLDLLVSILRHPDGEENGREAKGVGEHGHHRWKQGFNLYELIRDWGHLSQALHIFFHEHFDEQDRDTEEARAVASEMLTVFITDAMSNSVKRYDELRQAEAASLTTDLADLRDQFETLSRLRGDMLREAAHDIRNSLFSIASASHLLQKHEHADDDQARLDIIEHGVNSVLQLLNSLLDLSRLEAGHEKVAFTEVDVGEVLLNLGEESRGHCQQRQLDLKIQGPAPFHVITDQMAIRRVAQNLLNNAIRYTEVGSVLMRWEIDGDSWRLIVKDTGAGIQDIEGTALARQLTHDAEKSGEDPTKNASKGSGYVGEGIGLSIVKRLCDMLSGSIELESTRGVGTTFTLTFPRHPTQPPVDSPA